MHVFGMEGERIGSWGGGQYQKMYEKIAEICFQNIFFILT